VQKWEYMVRRCWDDQPRRQDGKDHWTIEGSDKKLDLSQALTALGSDGCELVAVQLASIPVGVRASRPSVQSFYIFKRPIGDD